MTLGPTDSDRSDLQHEDAPQESLPEREEAGENGAASWYLSPARPVAAAPDTERGAAAASSRMRRRAEEQRTTGAASPARSRLHTNLDGAFHCIYIGPTGLRVNI